MLDRDPYQFSDFHGSEIAINRDKYCCLSTEESKFLGNLCRSTIVFGELQMKNSIVRVKIAKIHFTILRSAQSETRSL